MGQISHALVELRHSLESFIPVQSGIQFIRVTVSAPHFSPLAWLESQLNYPKFYWQHRQGIEEVVVCGKVLSFDNIAAAENYLRQQQQPDVRIWGMNAFDEVQHEGQRQQGMLFIPRIEIIRRQDDLTITLYLDCSNHWREQQQQAIDFLGQLQPIGPFPVVNSKIITTTHLPEYPQWCELLTTALYKVQQQQFAKVVLARRTTLTLSAPLNCSAFMAASKQVNHHCYHFMLAFNPQQAFLGSSPERLYYRHRHALCTEALAGTVANSDNDGRAYGLASWLMSSGKNQQENLLVVDDICQRLRSKVRGIDVMQPGIVRLRKVQHLRRIIRAELLQESDAECLSALHPTAAIAGLPREAAKQFILQHEPFSRQWYAGSAGYLSLQQAEFSVALRSAWLEGATMQLYAGAGIVVGSNPQQEWSEVENKAAGLQTLLMSAEKKR